MADKQLSFWDHLDALRGVLIRAAVAVTVIAVAAFCVMPQMFDSVILALLSPARLYRGQQSAADGYVA